MYYWTSKEQVRLALLERGAVPDSIDIVHSGKTYALRIGKKVYNLHKKRKNIIDDAARTIIQWQKEQIK